MTAVASPGRVHRSSFPAAGRVIAGVRQTESGWLAAWWECDERNNWQLRGVTIGHRSPQNALKSFADAAGLSADSELGDEQEALLNRLRDAIHGQVDTFADVHLNLDHLGPFARKVVQRCRTIPAGKTVTYAELAATCGSPNAARAVGNVMASNRFPLIVPCHRVVGSGGGLGGFSAPQGIELKRDLLQREGVDI